MAGCEPHALRSREDKIFFFTRSFRLQNSLRDCIATAESLNSAHIFPVFNLEPRRRLHRLTMGAGASSSGPLGRTRSGAFKELDEDGSGTISLAEFSAAARAVGVEMKAEELKECFAKYDADGSGEIDASEFQHFFDERVSMYQHEDKVIVDQLSEEGLANIVPYIGPKEASRGFRKAHLILERNPAAAAAPMSDEVPLRPLHLLLLLDSPVEAGASTKAKIASAEAACKVSTRIKPLRRVQAFFSLERDFAAHVTKSYSKEYKLPLYCFEIRLLARSS